MKGPPAEVLILPSLLFADPALRSTAPPSLAEIVMAFARSLDSDEFGHDASNGKLFGHRLVFPVSIPGNTKTVSPCLCGENSILGRHDPD
jgi:hypothetical protein